MNIEPAKVVSDYERNLKKGGTVSCFGVLKLLNELLNPENKPTDKANIALRDRLYGVLTFGDKLFFGQNYSFDDRKPRDDLFNILHKEVAVTKERLVVIKKAVRVLPTSEKNQTTATNKISKAIELLEAKLVKKSK